MSRTKRVYNFPSSPISVWNHDKGWKPYWHPYKRIWSNKSFEWKYYELMSKRRREKGKIEIKREFLNFKTIFDLYGDEGFYSNCFRNCESWHWCCRQDGSCSQIGEVKIMSFKRAYSIK